MSAGETFLWLLKSKRNVFFFILKCSLLASSILRWDSSLNCSSACNKLLTFIQIICRSMVLVNINLESSNRSYSCQCFPKMRHKRCCSSQFKSRQLTKHRKKPKLMSILYDVHCQCIQWNIIFNMASIDKKLNTNISFIRDYT